MDELRRFVFDAVTVALHAIMVAVALLGLELAVAVAILATLPLHWLGIRRGTVTGFRADDRAVWGLTVVIAASVLAVRVMRPVEAAVLIGALLLLFAMRTVLLHFASEEAAEQLPRWRNLPLESPRAWSTGRDPAPYVMAVHSLLVAALVVVMWPNAAATSGRVLVAAAIAALLGAFGVALALALGHSARTSRHRMRESLRQVLAGLAPEIVVHLSGYPQSVHTVNVWVDSLERVGQRVMIIVRQPWHLDAVHSESLPVVFLPTSADLREMCPASALVALYPLQNPGNFELLGLRGIFDVFIGHGDSDKISSTNGINAAYDEVWVAGPAARDRHRRRQVGVRDEAVREVGRPQLAEITRTPRGVAASNGFVVLYAPTWEGLRPTPYSSLVALGPRLVASLLAMDGVRVLYKPHPSTGYRDRSMLVADSEIRSLIATAGAEHRVIEKLAGLYAAFNDADLLISDVSSVITDFLASGKPYIVTNPGDEDELAFRRRSPSATGGPLLGSTLAGLADLIADARVLDSWSTRRGEVSAHLLGTSVLEPRARFQQALDEVCEIQMRRRTAAAQWSAPQAASDS